MIRRHARLALREVERTEALVFFECSLAASDSPVTLAYRTRTGALARVDGTAVGSFDREHHEIVIAPAGAERIVRLEVERHALPTNRLPSRPDMRWWWMQARSHPRPSAQAELTSAAIRPRRAALAAPHLPLVLWGHSHLDVAWLWTYDEAKRKAVRTFVTALALIDRDPAFVFTQSQPQLYAFVREQDSGVFAALRDAIAAGRWDADVAAMWVEPDCNLPSGESLIRQMLFAERFCKELLGITPSIAWLPDSFGFPNTLPTLLGHCGINRFATTKLMWNDTTAFTHPQFIWRGPDGSEVVGALIASYEGGIDDVRIAAARSRNEPLVVGYGDGGGGPTFAQLEALESLGTWERPARWFERLEERRASLPVHHDELYLEYHRGVQTTHHDVKAANAELERTLAHVEELAAWCIAIHGPAHLVDRLRELIDAAWEIALRNQFHDVLPGTSIGAVYDDARREYGRARDVLASAQSLATAWLPRSAYRAPADAACEPDEREYGYWFENELIRARVTKHGALRELATADAGSAISQGNVLAIYRDRPKKWEAWNIDADYRKRARAAKPRAPSVREGGLEIPFIIGRSPATMRIELRAGEPFVRVALAIDWREHHLLLRCENWFGMHTDAVTYGTPHGTIRRNLARDTAAARARYEVPGQRFALASDAGGSGIAILALDTYGWDARALPAGGVRVGHSLLRGTRWPDERADSGEQRFQWAYAPFANATASACEHLWERFSAAPRVRLFTSDDPAVLVVACKPAADGNGIIVRVRECDGVPRSLRLRCGARMRRAFPVDGLERRLSGESTIERESLVGSIAAYGLAGYRVVF
ncbi:MAG: alpha-mannosidase [Vulcanimicrobiaceae bacterium]